MNIQIITTLISFTSVVIVCPFLLPFLRKLKFGQAERELGPKSHYKKAGTPTMGGVSMLLGITIACLVMNVSKDKNLFFALIVMLIYGLIGFLDDYIKVIQKNAIVSDKNVSSASLGMRPKHKLVLQFAVACALAFYVAYHPGLGTDIILPFSLGSWDLGIFFIPFIIFTTIAVVNAVNLSDGLDGLASGITLIVMLFFFIASIANARFEMSIFSAAVIGACLGFLCYNFNPAKVFMGDTGSMALGSAVAVVAIFTKTELFILIAGLIYVIEALSVVIQVSYFKLTHGKRFFKMAPIHHHFELCGWEETRVVMVFWVFASVCVMFSLLAAGIYFY